MEPDHQHRPLPQLRITRLKVHVLEAVALEISSPTRIDKKISRKGNPHTIDEDTQTPPAKKARPAGCGGSTKQATCCVVCERPRAGCPTCSNKMREHGVRSLQAVLSDESYREMIRQQSLKAKPIEDQDEVLQSKVSKMERLLKDLKGLAK